MFQALIKANKLKFFDYMSTVSGGGYIGACLSSLMSAEPTRRDKEWNNQGREPIKNINTKFDVGTVGLEEHNSLFTNEPYEYPNIETGKITTKHQLIHLRQHGEYLTPHKSIKDWDVHRLIGALFGGIIANVFSFLLFLSFVVLLHHALLALMSGDAFINTLQKPGLLLNQTVAQEDSVKMAQFRSDSASAVAAGQPIPMRPKIDSSKYVIPFRDRFTPAQQAKMTTTQQLGEWVENDFYPQVYLVWLGAYAHPLLPITFAGLGFVFALLFVFWARSLPYPTARQEQDEQNYTGQKPNDKLYDRHGEDDMLDLVEAPIKRWFFNIGLWGIPLGAYIVTAALTYKFGSQFNYFVMLTMPLCYSIGLFVGLHSSIFLYFINDNRERVSGWLYRSFYNGMVGGAVLIMLITAAFPIAIILLFGAHGLAVTLTFSFLPVTVAYYFTLQSLGGKDGAGFLNTLINRLRMPLLNLSIFLLVGMAFAWISELWYNLEYWIPEVVPFCAGWDRLMVVGLLLTTILVLLLIWGMAVNSNDISLHYFYRDRLSEAFLRTTGKMAVKVGGSDNDDTVKLVRMNLRNHEDLKLSNLGEGNFRGPYHLIVTALNLQGSHDLSAKTLKSEHFLFSKFFIGSRSTGYVSTQAYNYGGTKLSTAMAISGAAVSSGMGALSFAASNFYLTLFNLRTGYWIDNPRHFIREEEKKIRAANPKPVEHDMPKIITTDWTFWKNLQGRWARLTRKYPLWLVYTWRELTGNMGSNTAKINVSDGGHTGDNLGILPLLQRRCSTIVVADFEADGKYSFDSFGQAVRLAKSIYNVDINIDLSKLMPQKNDAGEVYSPASVTHGVITYNLTRKNPNTGQLERYKKTGQIVYMKSSISLLKEAAENETSTINPALIVTEPAPVMVLNYFKKNPQFPHQTTADQYFDEVQFEAYRMLGEHIGKQAVEKIKFKPLETT
jgi:hypothetical protein